MKQRCRCFIALILLSPLFACAKGEDQSKAVIQGNVHQYQIPKEIIRDSESSADWQDYAGDGAKILSLLLSNGFQSSMKQQVEGEITLLIFLDTKVPNESSFKHFAKNLVSGSERITSSQTQTAFSSSIGLTKTTYHMNFDPNLEQEHNLGDLFVLSVRRFEPLDVEGFNHQAKSLCSMFTIIDGLFVEMNFLGPLCDEDAGQLVRLSVADLFESWVVE